MMWIDDRPSVPCGLCGTPTPMTGTKRCDRCWELESRIYSDPALAQKILDDMKQQGQATPPNTPVDMITLSEFMAEQEALHPGIHDKVQAAADELRASLAQQPAEPSKTVNVVGMPEFDGLLDHIYEYGTAAEGVIEKANAFARAVIARYAPQQPVAVDRAYPTPRNRAEAVALARLALAYLGVIDAHIDAAVARCETDLATQHREPTP